MVHGSAFVYAPLPGEPPYRPRIEALGGDISVDDAGTSDLGFTVDPLRIKDPRERQRRAYQIFAQDGQYQRAFSVPDQEATAPNASGNASGRKNKRLS